MKEVGPFACVGDDLEYRRCDFCHESAVMDVWAGKHHEADWRRFYELPDGLCVCSLCVARTSKDALA